MLRHPAFLDGDTDTAFFDTHGLAELAAPLADPSAPALSALAAALADAAAEPQRRNGSRRPAQRLAQPGVGLPDQAVRRRGGRRARGARTGSPAAGLELDGDDAVTLVSSTPDRVVLAVDGVERPFDVARYGDDVFVDSPLGPVRLTAQPRFPDPDSAVAQGSLLAPMPGSVTGSAPRSATR